MDYFDGLKQHLTSLWRDFEKKFVFNKTEWVQLFLIGQFIYKLS